MLYEKKDFQCVDCFSTVIRQLWPSTGIFEVKGSKFTCAQKNAFLAKPDFPQE